MKGIIFPVSPLDWDSEILSNLSKIALWENGGVEIEMHIFWLQSTYNYITLPPVISENFKCLEFTLFTIAFNWQV